MDPRQYSGQRRNCLHAMNNTQRSQPSQDSYEVLHEQVQRTLEENRPSSQCSCQSPSLCPSLPYVTAYVNPQDYTGLVSPEMALQRGSAFNNLYWPYNERRKC